MQGNLDAHQADARDADALMVDACGRHLPATTEIRACSALTFDMRGGQQQAKLDVGRPLDGRVRAMLEDAHGRQHNATKKCFDE